jgi:SAM-dependent methyltransferase
MPNLKETYDKIAEFWLHDHADDDWWIGGTNTFLSYLKPGAAILDVGCGAGVKSAYLAGKGFRVTGIDFSDRMIELSRQRVSGASFYIKDIYSPLGFKNEFDGIFAQAVLLHIPKRDIPKVLNNILEPLKVSGYFYIAVKEQRDNEQGEEMVTENDYVFEYQRFFSYFKLGEVKNYLTQAGIQIINEVVTTSGRRNWIQVVGKK